MTHVLRYGSVRAVPAVELQSLDAFRTTGPLQNPGTVAGCRRIVQEADNIPVLRQVARDVPEELFDSEELRKLGEELVAAMRSAPGVGLAAPQIGVDLKVIVAEDREEYVTTVPESRLPDLKRHPFQPLIICNPQLEAVGSEGYRYWEGCLSVSGYQAMVERYTTVKVSGYSIDGRALRFMAHGWQARILQHECDHVNGTLYIDRAILSTVMAHKALEEAEAEAEVKYGPCQCRHPI